LPGGPYGIAVRGDLAYVTRSQAAAIERLDLATGRFVGTIPLGCAPTCVAFDPTGARAYVSVHYRDEVAIVDTERHVPTGAFPVPGDPMPLALSRGGQTLFVTTNTDRLFGLNARNGRIIGSLPLPATSHHFALHPAGDRLYVATRTAGTVLEVDTMRYRVLRTFTLGGWPQGLVVTPDGSTLYAANEQHGLDVITLGTGRNGRLPLAGGAVSLALSPDGRFLYTGLVHAGKVGVIEVAPLKLRDSITTGGRPRQIAFDARSYVFVVNEAGWIDVLPAGTHRIPSASHPLTSAPALQSAS
jgi:YVTN family beta-propeller protein